MDLIKYKTLPEKFRSKYLDDYFPYEKLKINEVIVDLENKKIQGNVSIELNGTSPDFYQWSSITAYRAAVQLALGYAGTYLNKSKKEIGEVVQKEAHLFTEEPIYDKNNQQIEIKITKLLERRNYIFGNLEYQIKNTKFSGKINKFAIGFR